MPPAAAERTHTAPIDGATTFDSPFSADLLAVWDWESLFLPASGQGGRILMAFQGILCALPLFCGQDCPSCRLKLCPCAVSTARGLFAHKFLCTNVFADQPIPGASRESSPVSLYVGCAPWCRVASAGGSAGARSAFHRRAARRKSTATANAPNADEQKRGGGRRGTRAARKKAAASAPASKDARAGTTKAADDGTPATLPPHERDTAGGLAAALATAERERTTGTRRAACLNAAPPTREPTVETMDARPKRETRPTGTRAPIAGREARMHERKTLAGQGGHAPPGTSTALKRRLNLGRPEKELRPNGKPVWGAGSSGRAP